MMISIGFIKAMKITQPKLPEVRENTTVEGSALPLEDFASADEKNSAVL